MSLNLASFYRRAVSGSFEAVRQRVHRDHPRDDPERLERIATYARAGYFNMGYTLESFSVIAEIAPD
ncbi:hypothetical protein [Paraburkholderia atlantica]|uniref:Uncharacterized protein n=1 Tax=Paraburkholderia atlantica TaxID=2654982 RepID=D5WMK3_PARAM|nr:hypothetical protein [Paraburkholderia atlantica]ADG20449.1 conserved hypothetical protein [Paraburkholderia atlantica]MBB5510154.1 uncharacterized protein YjhX (UPF0386 family) [Paraburkholderia atlantica]